MNETFHSDQIFMDSQVRCNPKTDNGVSCPIVPRSQNCCQTNRHRLAFLENGLLLPKFQIFGIFWPQKWSKILIFGIFEILSSRRFFWYQYCLAKWKKNFGFFFWIPQGHKAKNFENHQFYQELNFWPWCCHTWCIHVLWPKILQVDPRMWPQNSQKYSFLAFFRHF